MVGEVIILPAYKDKVKGTWYVAFYYTSWTGERVKKMKRGFATKREAAEWERTFMLQKKADLNMTFEAFVKIYSNDMKTRLKENTWRTKDEIIGKKILPYFKEKKMSEIQPKDIIQWQNTLIDYRNKDGKPYSPTYLRTIHNQISSIFNHAVKFYDLRSNPASKAGSIGKKNSKEMKFWTLEEYEKFSISMMDKPMSFIAFEILYWTGGRLGEILALTPNDFDFERETVTINKSFQRIKGRDVITEPKTPKSNRIISLPDFLVEEIKEYLSLLYKVDKNSRMFPISKGYLHHEMDRGAKEQNVKRIRIHDLRHSHVSLLINRGFSALDIAERLGHESIEVTYKYAHLFPSKQAEMAKQLSIERREVRNEKSIRQKGQT